RLRRPRMPRLCPLARTRGLRSVRYRGALARRLRDATRGRCCHYAGAAVSKGIFSKWQPRYAEHGIATFPVDETKKPRIRGWQKIGLRASTELADKFTDADALGYLTGRRSNVTVLDIDTADEKVAEDAIRRHGQPAIVTRTASGKKHHLYRYN